MPDLPPTIAAYFAATNARDADAFADCFTAEAVVRDDGGEHRGIDAITAWRAQTMAKTPFEARPLSIRSDGDRHVVSAEVSGDFPNSPVMLDHDFALRDGVIDALEIH